MQSFIQPDWPLADNVKSLITTRFSLGAASDHNKYRETYGDFNLGDHVGDDPHQVVYNRQQLVMHAKLPAMPVWQQQVHGTQVQVLGKTGRTDLASADACYTDRVNTVCAMLTADCLPVLLADMDGKEVAAVHAGWRGLLGGVIENTLSHFASTNIMAYLGPAISQTNYQVGYEVYRAFVQRDAMAEDAFIADGNSAYKMDIYLLAKQRLQSANVTRIYGGNYCTYAEERFYSYRQACRRGDGSTGRMASLIWLNVQR